MLPTHTLPRVAVLIVLIVGVPSLYFIISMKLADAHPRVGRVLFTIFLSLGYGFVGTIVAAVFLGSHIAPFLYPLLVLIATPRAWKDAKSAIDSWG